MAGRRRVRPAAQLLGRAIARRPRVARLADRPPAPAGAKLQRGALSLCRVRAGHRRLARPGARCRRHHVHAGGRHLECFAGALLRAGRHLHRHAEREPAHGRNRTADRLFRQYAGAAHARGQAKLCAIAATGARQRAGCAVEPGHPVRVPGRSAAARARAEPVAAVPGDVRHAEHAYWRAGKPGLADQAARHRPRARPFRLRRRRLRERRATVRLFRVQHRPVRRRHHRAHGRRAGAPAGRRAGQPAGLR